jgi:hypothetical protein
VSRVSELVGGFLDGWRQGICIAVSCDEAEE